MLDDAQLALARPAAGRGCGADPEVGGWDAEVGVVGVAVGDLGDLGRRRDQRDRRAEALAWRGDLRRAAHELIDSIVKYANESRGKRNGSRLSATRYLVVNGPEQRR